VSDGGTGGQRGDPLGGRLPPTEALTRPLGELVAALAPRLESVTAPPPPDRENLRQAGVVALLTRTPDPGRGRGPGVVLIERSRALHHHAGQIALPGGKPEPADEGDLWRTALREAGEEVGLEGPIEPLGRLHPVPTPTGFWIVPFVAAAPASFRPSPASAEVAQTLVPALAYLSDPARHRVTGRVPYRGRTYDMHEFDLGLPVPLWGATARVIWDLLRRLAPA